MRKGDRVRIKGLPGAGTILRRSQKGRRWVDIRWDNGKTSRYRMEDVERSTWTWDDLSEMGLPEPALHLELTRDEGLALLACARTGWAEMIDGEHLGAMKDAALMALKQLEEVMSREQ